MRWGTVVLSFIAFVLAAALWFVFWPNEERVVRGRLGDIAKILTVPVNESDLARVSRLSHMRDYLSPNAQIRYSNQEPASREAVMAALAQWGRSPDGVKVEFVDVQVTFDAAQPNLASAYLTAKVSGRDSIDAREADVKLARENGVWVVTSAEARETLTR